MRAHESSAYWSLLSQSQILCWLAKGALLDWRFMALKEQGVIRNSINLIYVPVRWWQIRPRNCYDDWLLIHRNRELLGSSLIRWNKQFNKNNLVRNRLQILIKLLCRNIYSNLSMGNPSTSLISYFEQTKAIHLGSKPFFVSCQYRHSNCTIKIFSHSFCVSLTQPNTHKQKRFTQRR